MSVARNMEDVYVSRLFSGIALGATLLVAPVFIAEIADSRISGFLSTTFTVTMNIGIVSEFVCAEFTNFRTVSAILVVFSTLTTCGIICIHDSPQYLLSRKKKSLLYHSYKFYNEIKQDAVMCDEDKLKFKLWKMENKIDAAGFKFTPVDIFPSINAFIVSLFPLLSGAYVIMTYNHQIFDMINVQGISTFVSSLLFVIIQLVGSAVTSYIIDYVGRRRLLIISSFMAFTCLGIFSIYIQINTTSYVPIASLLVYVLSISVGLVSIPGFYAIEFLNIRVRMS